MLIEYPPVDLAPSEANTTISSPKSTHGTGEGGLVPAFSCAQSAVKSSDVRMARRCVVVTPE